LFALRTLPETPIIPSKRPKTAEGKSRAYVTALARGLSVMKAFNEQHASLTLSDVARIVGLPRASARRALLTLQSLGYVESNGRMFSLSPQVLTLARAYLASSPVPRVAQGFLENLSEGLGESCSLSILHGDEVIYIARSTRKRIGSLHRDVGAHLPAHCTSMGRVLLAALPDAQLSAFITATNLNSFTPYTTIDKDELGDIMQKVRRNGYSLVDQELEIELRSIAVPVHNAGGRVIAAMNVS
jgi:IclR family pca regulon transcriptional regulator